MGVSRGRQRRSFGFFGRLQSTDNGLQSATAQRSVVRCPQRTKQPSRGYQRGRANAKTSVHPATYGNLCTSVWFCKDTKTEIAIVHLCPLMSIYVHLCPLILAKTHYSKHLQNRIFAQTCNSLLVIWRCTAALLYNRENNPLPIVLRNPKRQQSTCGLVDSQSCSLKTTGYRPAHYSWLKVQNCPANPNPPYLRPKSAMVSPLTPIVSSPKYHTFDP